MKIPIKCNADISCVVVGSSSLYELQCFSRKTGKLVYRYGFLVSYGVVAQLDFKIIKRVTGLGSLYEFRVSIRGMGFSVIFQDINCCFRTLYSEDWHSLGDTELKITEVNGCIDIRREVRNRR